jgi:hypothetical protein
LESEGERGEVKMGYPSPGGQSYENGNNWTKLISHQMMIYNINMTNYEE